MVIVTKELNIHGLQCNSVAMECEQTFLHIMLMNGKKVSIECNNPNNAREIMHTILYYPINKDNSGHEFNFSFKVTIE